MPFENCRMTFRCAKSQSGLISWPQFRLGSTNSIAAKRFLTTKLNANSHRGLQTDRVRLVEVSTSDASTLANRHARSDVLYHVLSQVRFHLAEAALRFHP